MGIVDINSDMGEGFGEYKLGMDEEVIKHISSVNIACGYHGGDPIIMEETVKMAIKYNVAIGAHPGYPDLIGFGRRNMDITPKEARAYMLYQLGALSAFARANNTRIQHIKLHGAFYNTASSKIDMAKEIIRGVLDIDKDLILLVLSGSHLGKLAREKGVKVAQEVFADRAYNDDGSLVNRRLEGAFIHDKRQAFIRIKEMIVDGKVTTISGKKIPIEADSICVHGDNPRAVDFAEYIRNRLIEEKIEVKSLNEFL